jgi:hypothetical protein
MCAEIVDVMLAASRCAGLRANPRVKGLFDVVELTQLDGADWSDAVLLAQDPQFAKLADEHVISSDPFPTEIYSCLRRGDRCHSGRYSITKRRVP